MINVGLAGSATTSSRRAALRRARLAAAGAGRSPTPRGRSRRSAAPARRRRQRHRVRALPRRAAGARRHRAGARRACRHGRRPARDPARRTADRVAADVRPDAAARSSARSCSKAGPIRSTPRARSSTRGGVELEPCHHHGAVGPMAGIISPSMPLGWSRTRSHGNRAYCNFNEGLGKVLRFGANGPEVIDRLRWIASDARADVARRAEAHRRHRIDAVDGAGARHGRRGPQPQRRGHGAPVQAPCACAVRRHRPRDAAARSLAFLAGNDHFFLNLSMAACKAMLDAAHGRCPAARMVVGDGAQRRQLRRSPRRAPASAGSRRPPIRSTGLYFPGYSVADAAPDLGDSAITETAGVGGFAMAAAPAIVKFVGGIGDRRHCTTACACARSRWAPIASFTLPALDFAPACRGHRRAQGRRLAASCP